MNISVIIPAYNAASTLAECLDGVVGQRFAPHEVVVVNDGSTDETAEIASSYASKLPIVLIEQENKGLGASRNIGMAKATGDVYAFLDADDVWLEGKLAEAKEALEKHPDSSWFYAPVWEWNGTSRRKRSCAEVDGITDYLAFNPLVPSTVVIRKSLPLHWEEDKALQEDVGAYLKLFSEGYVPKKIGSRSTLYRVDYGMTADVEDHVEKVTLAIDKAFEYGHLSADQYQLYLARKAYEMARTYQKRGDKGRQKVWKRKALERSAQYRLPLALRVRIWWVI